MKQAFFYMFSDNKFLQKYITIVLFILIPVIAIVSIKIAIIQLILIILLIPLFLIMSGYWINCIKAIINQSQNIVLPCINIKNNIVMGSKLLIAELILGLIMFIVTLFGAGITTIMPFLNYILVPVFKILLIAIYILIIAFVWIFAKTDDIYSYIRISEAIEYVFHNKKDYFLALILCLIIDLLGNITIKFMPHNFILLLLEIFIVPYLMFLTAYIYARAIKVK